MENLPIYVPITFCLTILAAIWLFYKATNASKFFLIIAAVWIALLSVLGIGGFFNAPDAVPPRFPLIVLPPFVLIVLLFMLKSGRRFLDSLSVRGLTLVHSIGIPVEIVLYWLFLNKTVPALMTFEGRNFDIISGLSAPVIWYFGFVRPKLNKTVIILWNLICLGLLINVSVYAVLSVPGDLQKFAFDQPNIALGYFPFLLLPGFVVPLVLLSHLAAIRNLLKANKAVMMIK